jgi:hypothetical protein
MPISGDFCMPRDNKNTAVFSDFLTRWPTLKDAQRARKGENRGQTGIFKDLIGYRVIRAIEDIGEPFVPVIS